MVTVGRQPYQPTCSVVSKKVLSPCDARSWSRLKAGRKSHRRWGSPVREGGVGNGLLCRSVARHLHPSFTCRHVGDNLPLLLLQLGSGGAGQRYCGEEEEQQRGVAVCYGGCRQATNGGECRPAGPWTGQGVSAMLWIDLQDCSGSQRLPRCCSGRYGWQRRSCLSRLVPT